MKKAAVCFSGHVRNYSAYLDFFKTNIIDANRGYDFDVFISTWSTRNTINSHAYKRGEIDCNTFDINDLIQAYNPTSILIEKCNVDVFHQYKHYIGGAIPEAVFAQFYKLKQVFKLLSSYKESNNLNYEVVIRARFDYRFKHDINIEGIDLSNFNVENEGMGEDWVSDKFSISTYDIFMVYATFFDNLERLIHKTQQNISERLLSRFLVENNIKVFKNDMLNPYSWPPL